MARKSPSPPQTWPKTHVFGLKINPKNLHFLLFSFFLLVHTTLTSKRTTPMNNSHFRRGQSTFTCNCCKRLTRDTGVQSIGPDLCPQCYELAGLENCVQDNCFTDHDAREAKSLVQELVA